MLQPITNDKITAAHGHSKSPWITELAHFNDNYQIQGGPGDDVFYADGNTEGDSYTVNGQTLNSKSFWIFNTKDSIEAKKLHDPKPGLPTAVGSYRVKVQVDFQGILSQAIAIDDKSDYQINQQDIHQAIKQAVNGDAVLSKLLQATDGPNGTLLVASKINFSSYEYIPYFNFFDLKINLLEPNSNEISPEIVQNFITRHPRSGLSNASSMLEYIKNQVTSHSSSSQSLYSQFYKETYFAIDDMGTSIRGAKSHLAKDHIIEGGTGNDLIVLGSAFNHHNSFKSSNDTLKYSGVFGHDTILNFEKNGYGFDKFHFTQLHRT